MRLSIIEPATVIKWGRGLLYIVIFISFLIVYGRWNDPTTYTFLGSVLCLIIPMLFFLKDEQQENQTALKRVYRPNHIGFLNLAY